MSSNDQAIALITQLVLSTDGAALIGVAFSYIAVKTWQKYFFTSSALNKIRQASNLNKISDLRQLLDKEEAAYTNNSDGKLVVVRGIVEAKGSIDALVSNETGERAVLLQNTQTCIYNEWRGLLGWAIFGKKEQKFTSVRMIPFVLLDIGRSSTSDYLFVNMDDSKHPLPLSTIYHKLQPVQTSPYTFLQAVFGHAYPVALLDEEKVLSIGKHISVVGVCSFNDGVPQIKSSQALPYFLTEMTKDQLLVDLAFKENCLFWGGLILGSLSVGILGYAAMRNWGRWKEWRQRRRQSEQSEEADFAAVAAMDKELQGVVGEVPDGELCVICLMRRRRSAFDPCGHMVCCPGCALSVRRDSSPKCPVCMQEIRYSIVIYAS